MFINFWYPAIESAELNEAPVKTRMLGQDFVLYRDGDGIARCLSNTCTHRGGSLGDGKIRDGHIECPYHGWQFDGSGACRKIPSLGKDASIPARTAIDAYPVEERYGLIFCFLGDLPKHERPPIMNIPEWDQEGWTYTIQRFDFDIYYERSMENGVDPAHNEFVHDTHGYSGDRDDYEVPKVTLDKTEWGTGFGLNIMAPPLPEGDMKDASGRSEDAVIYVGTGHEGVASLWTYIHPTPDMHIQQYAFEKPVDEDHTTIFLVNLRNFMLDDKADETVKDRNAYVAYQDRDVLMDLHPAVTPKTNTSEFFMPSDACVAAYRDRLKEWEQKGWRIDTKKVADTEKRVAYAIPSPERRERKSWVLDPVPLVGVNESGEN